MERTCSRTDGGTQSLPAWVIQISGAASSAYVLAIAASGRFPATDGPGLTRAGQGTLSADGRHLTVPFVGHQDAGVCTAGFTNTLTTAETASGVVITVTQRWYEPPIPPPGAVCNFDGYRPASPNARTPTTTITLAAPLGNRLVTDAKGNPYVVAKGSA